MSLNGDRLFIATPNAPTPGIIRASASEIIDLSEDITTFSPILLKALCMLRKLPLP
jgi:hypothetical protein